MGIMKKRPTLGPWCPMTPASWSQGCGLQGKAAGGERASAGLWAIAMGHRAIPLFLIAGEFAVHLQGAAMIGTLRVFLKPRARYSRDVCYLIAFVVSS